MVRCPICKGEENDRVFSREQEYRGKHFEYGIYYCPRCGVKFSFSTPMEVERPEARTEEEAEEAPQEAS